MAMQRRFVRVAAFVIFLAALVAPLARAAGAQGDWFDRMAVPLASGRDFVSMRDASLRGVGLYPAAEMMLGPWYVVGTFAREGSSSVPLRNVDVSAKIKTDAGPVAWQTVAWDDPKQPLDLAPLFKRRENVSAYLYRSIQSPGRASIELRVSADDDFTVWLNGRKVIGPVEDGGAAAYAKHKKRLWLKKGENEIVVRVGQASGPWRLFFDFEPKIDPRIEAKILSESLKAFPKSPGSWEGRVRLARLFLEIGERERALEQAGIVAADPGSPPKQREIARAILRRFLDLSLSTDRPWNLFTKDDLSSRALPVRVTVRNNSATTAAGEVAIRVSDVWGRKVADPPPIKYNLAPGKSLDRPVSFAPAGWGAYLVRAATKIGKVPVQSESVVVFIPKAWAGLRPESFFAATVENGVDLSAVAKIGIKITRSVLCNYKWVLKKTPRFTTEPIQLDFSRLDREIAERKKHDLWVLPVVADARPLVSSLAARMKASGPPRDYREFTAVTGEIVKHFPKIRYWDFWGDPWIYGPTWSGSAATFAYFLKMWSEKIKQVRPDVKVLAGGRPSFFIDNISPNPNAAKAIDALTNRLTYDARAPDWRSGAVLRSMDFTVREAKRRGIGMAFVTGSKTDLAKGRPGITEAHRLDAAKIVKLHVMAALAGCYQANVDQGDGWGRDCPVGDAAYAVMTHLLEDRPIVADIWPSQPLLWGAVFANPRWITDEVKALPRASEISARWNVPVPKERAGDSTKVAVVWSQTGPEAGRLDEKGTLTIRPAGDLRALDMFGRPTGRKQGDALVVPFTQYPVYLLSEKLSVVQIRNRIAEARIEGVTPVNSYLFSLPAPLGERPTTLTARVQNQLNRPLKGKISLRGPKDWKIEPPARDFELKPAELAEISFAVTATTSSAINQYPVRTTIELEGRKYERNQVVEVACVRPMKVTVDGKLDEWTTAVFVRMDSEQLRDPEGFFRWLAEGASKARKVPEGRAFVGVKLALGYDARYFYIAAVVREPGLGNATNGNPASYTENPLTNGDCLEMAFGFNERAQDDYRKAGDPWYWKGMFRDVDYVVIQTRSRADQPILQSLYVPGLPWRTDYQTARYNVFNIPGRRSQFVRDETALTTTYEIAIPRNYLKRFDPAKPWFRFGAVYFNDEKLPPLEWSRACGVFDYWTNFGSYLPAWQPLLACQTRWGIVR